ncbi:MAG: PP2C family protein-serine/threonine phosphatase [Acidimicrobiales bacterium]
MFDLRSFGLTDILECGAVMRHLGRDASSMEDAARAVVRYLHAHLIDKETNEPAVVLVRLYKTHRFDEREPDLRAFAEARSATGRVGPAASCLTLLATAGDEPAWNDRHQSRSHRAIPLQDSAAVKALPMVYALTRSFGLGDDEVVRPEPALFHARSGRPGGVFFVPDAAGSECVPAQEDFVEPFGIRSVVGFGGLLPSGYVFAVVMFAKVAISRDVAEAFGSLAFAAQLALLPFVERQVFEGSPVAGAGPVMERDLRIARAEVAALGHLLDTRHEIVAEQATRLEQARREAEDRANALERSRRSLEASEAVKAAILNAALDCVITMDDQGRVIDFNPAAERTFGYGRNEAVGRLLADLIIPAELREAHRSGLDRYLRTGCGSILGQRIEISALRSDGREFPVELTVAAVEAGGRRLFSGHLRDISDRVEAEGRLRAAGERYAEVARILQASLLPPALPVVPGADIASAYRPGQEGLDVGGDFYDVFAVGGDRWGVVLGDVMGKGAEAAAATALARYTVRAAAMSADKPTEALCFLNDALYRNDPERLCTAVYALFDVGRRPGLLLASGGHPPPLLRRASCVSVLQAPGPLLGPFPDWAGVDLQVDLQPGDLVLFYSDGVTEARRGHEQYGMDRLIETLAATGTADAAGTVATIAGEVARFATAARDDVAVVALTLAGAGSKATAAQPGPASARTGGR